MDSINALGRRPERNAAFTGNLLSEAEDEELQAIVREAARDLSTPIALVNLVLEHIQFFKAHHGLPADLVAARGTDRDVSFCQFVVREGEPFEVEDAELDERVPKHLVKHYGIRAYLGMPIVANETIVGSLCVIDTKPRTFSEEERHNLKKLANLVNIRLSAMAKKQRGQGLSAKEVSAAPAIAELHKALAPIQEEALSGRIAIAAVAAFLRLVDYSLWSENLPPAVIEQSMHAAREALENSRDRLYGIEASTDYAKNSLSVLENILTQERGSQLIDIVQAGLALMAPALKPVGGAALSDNATERVISTPRALGVSLFSTCLSLVAAQMASQGLSAGIELKIHGTPVEASIVFNAEGLPEEALRELSDRLARHIGGHETVGVHGTEGLLYLSFAVSPDGNK